MSEIRKCTIALTAALIASGCTVTDAFNKSAENTESMSVAVVTTVVEHCSPIDSDLFYEDVFNAVHSGGNAYFINADSTPAVYKAEFKRLKKSLSESQKADAHQQSVRKCFKEDLPSVLNPDSAETDTYAAICEAVKALKADPASTKKLIVISHGIITSGLLSMNDSVISNIDTDAVMNFLEENHELPDMSDITVDFWLADPCGDQKLYGPDTYKLKELYQKLFYTAGTNAEIQVLANTSSAELSADGTCHVTVIPTIAPSMDPSAFTDLSENTMIELPDTEIAFMPDRAELLNPEDARKTISQIAEIMASQKDTGYIIAGFTATVGNADTAKKLSRQRAEAVKQLLCETGLDPGRFKVVGLGYESTNIFHVNDIKNGRLDEKLAAQNRRILILTDTIENERKVGLID